MRELLERWNPWWNDGKVPPGLVGIPRGKYLGELSAQAKERRISVVSGPRRAGKTTILHQVIYGLLASDVKPSHILYAQLDHPGLGADIGAILKEHRRANRLPSGERAYVFLDEAQHAKDWALWAKAIHDQGNTKLFISGSTTALLEKDAFASLTGRWRKSCIWPLDFSEFLEFRGIKASKSERHLEASLLRDYAAIGGFPEAVCEDDRATRERMLVELFDDMVLKDAARTRNLRDSSALRSVAVMLMASVGTPLSVNKVRNSSKLSADAINGYVDALCGAYLFFPCGFHSKSVNERTYNPKKYYAIDPGMASAVMGKVNVGTAVENLLALHYYKKGDIGYWKSDGELDLVVDGMALESKFKNRIESDDLKGGLAFAKRSGRKKLYVATEELDDDVVMDGMKVIMRPAARMLLGDEGPGQER
jgi:predicted AAA+ superfamily ATPase